MICHLKEAREEKVEVKEARGNKRTHSRKELAPSQMQGVLSKHRKISGREMCSNFLYDLSVG